VGSIYSPCYLPVPHTPCTQPAPPLAASPFPCCHTLHITTSLHIRPSSIPRPSQTTSSLQHYFAAHAARLPLRSVALPLGVAAHTSRLISGRDIASRGDVAGHWRVSAGRVLSLPELVPHIFRFVRDQHAVWTPGQARAPSWAGRDHSRQRLPAAGLARVLQHRYASCISYLPCAPPRTGSLPLPHPTALLRMRGRARADGISHAPASHLRGPTTTTLRAPHHLPAHQTGGPNIRTT